MINTVVTAIEDTINNLRKKQKTINYPDQRKPKMLGQ